MKFILNPANPPREMPIGLGWLRVKLVSMVVRFPGLNDAISGNRLLDNGELAVAFSSSDWIDDGSDAQSAVCGNEYNGETMADPGRVCGESVPMTDGIGHSAVTVRGMIEALLEEEWHEVWDFTRTVSGGRSVECESHLWNNGRP